MNVKFTLNGRSVNPNNLGRELEKQFIAAIPKIAADHAVTEARYKLRNLRCAEHNQGISKVWATSVQDSTLNLNFEGCCDNLLAAAQNLISQG
jgi:hypothetical protein